MGRPSARTVALRDQIVAALRTEWPLPVSTRHLCELLGARRYDETGYRVYPQLCALARLGVVERIRREPECRDVFWRFQGDPTDADLNAVVDALEPSPIQEPREQQRADETTDGLGEILSTLDSYISALDMAEERFTRAAASGDCGAERNAVDELAALVRQFVNVCTDWPGPSRPRNAE
ncbi:hypothetical protein FIV07_28005 (plasmid) [Mycobacterium sp. THAF192]|nr:hypothetical protein FIV07_28005 [Mycobacterium sp. THAF192]